jgi:uncharacterized SAM-binding protein YcdF (DUF218 family)
MKFPFSFPRLVCLLPPLIVVLGLMLWSLPSPLIAKKVLALLILPQGLVWLGLMAAVGWRELKRPARGFALLLLMLYTLAGNSWFGGWLLGKLESPYSAPAGNMQFDAVFVLGGGSSSRPDGNTQLGPAGDRLIVPVQLFRAGRTPHLVASGLSVTEMTGSRSLADETASFWIDLGIPDASITRLSKPRTTREEIVEYKKLIAAKGWKSVGLCSSAWHLRRAEAICRDEGLRMVPIPADFLSGSLPWNALYAVPQARGFQNVQKALWEYLGVLTGA